MKQFLANVTEQLTNQFGHNLSKVAVVFPNQRASIFMDKYLGENMKDKPIWTPKYYSINQLFDELCPLKADDPIRSVFTLYNIYTKHIKGSGAKETDLNYFYSWGQQLLADFNNIDKNMAPAEQVLRNASDIWKLEDFSESEQETKNKLRNIFLGKNSEDAHSKVREDFQTIWNNLHHIYKEFNEILTLRGEGYSGARCRRVIEEMASDESSIWNKINQYDKFVFVGFNLLLKTEEKLFEYIQSKGKAMFFWDIDPFFMDDKNQFTFYRYIRSNLQKFPNELKENNENSHKDLKINFVAAASNNGQVHYTSQWIDEHHTQEEECKTAIVLCDENQLQAVLHTIPGNKVHDINITKGFPLGNTIAFTDVLTYFDTCNKDLKPLERLYQLTQFLQKQAQAKLPKEKKNTWEEILCTESYYQCITTIQRLTNILEDMNSTLKIDNIALYNLLLQILKAQTIPFKGEPATGLQVMGMLETRNLDFEQILMLNVNEGNVPKKSVDHSFLPFDLRKAFHLTTNEEESEVYAYNFFRLLQRCKHISYLYNAQGENNCEKSRFLQQLNIHPEEFNIEHFTLKEAQTKIDIPVQGVCEEEVKEALKYKGSFSPSALIQFMECPMKFYFSSVAYLSEDIKPSDLLPSNVMGSIFHETMQQIYLQLMAGKTNGKYGTPISSKEIKAYKDNEVKIEETLTQAFFKVSGEDMLNNPTGIDLFKQTYPNTNLDNLTRDKKKEYGIQLLNQHRDLALYKKEEHLIEYAVIKTYVKHMLEKDAENNTIYMVEMEKKHQIEMGGKKVGGLIDRIDVVEEKTIDEATKKENTTLKLRVIDYKTGSYKKEKTTATAIDNLFPSDKDGKRVPINHDKGYFFQALLYCITCLEMANEKELPIEPMLFFTQQMKNKDFDPHLKLNKKAISNFQNDVQEEFSQKLENLIQEVQTTAYKQREEKECQYCPFTQLCNKKKAKF